MKWIDPKDKLPKPYEMVLVLHQYEDGSIQPMITARSRRNTKTKLPFIHQDEYGFLCQRGLYKVIVWMPIPKYEVKNN